MKDATNAIDDAAIRAIERPSKSLLTLYFLQAALTLFAFPFVFIPLYFRYHTLRYRFDDEGVSARWGILFRKEIYLTYRRIQDIHVHRNVIERWLGIGRVELQTASGSADAELTVEGMVEYDAIRDHLYARMRGTSGADATDASAEGGAEDVVELLAEIRDELAGARRALEERSA